MFFKIGKKKQDTHLFSKICALLIHAAKIDENYTNAEEEIIKKTLRVLGLEKEEISKIKSNFGIYKGS